jgi:hypothetical protein
MSEESVISRLAQVLYIIGGIASVVFVVLSIEPMMELFTRWSEKNWAIDGFMSDYLLKRYSLQIVGILAAACASYGLGWSIRFVVTGETKSVIDRLKR